MKLNYDKSRPRAYLDFETQSQCPLTTVHRYSTHPSTRALTCVVKIDDTYHRLGPYLDGAALQFLENLSRTHTMVAHNAPFDAAIWENCCKLPECDWWDTVPTSRAAGFPGALDAIGTILTGAGKDKNGDRLKDMLCILRSDRVPVIGPAHKLLMDYNQRDVELLEVVCERTKDFAEPAVIRVDRTVNDRGVPIDRTMLLKLIELFDRNFEEQSRNFAERAPSINPNSPKQVKDWLSNYGFKVDSIGKATMKDMEVNPDKYFCGDTDMDAAYSAVMEALEYRKEVARVGKGKARAALEILESDDRIREQEVYYGAHTGRWSGRKLQLHNMPRTVGEIDLLAVEPEYNAVVDAARRASEVSHRRVYTADVLNAMLRHMVRADNLLVADYNAVEGRGIAWVAGCGKMLDLFADPKKSVYLDMGAHVFGRPITKKGDSAEYVLAKALVLGCGYGMSGAKFDFTCRHRGTNTSSFERAGMKAGDAVKIYRAAYPEIPAIWKAYHSAVHAAVGGCPTEAGKCQFTMVGPDLHMVLPSGRPMVYRNARIEMRVPGYCKLYGMPETPVPTVVFDKPHGLGFLYGSKVAENAVQGICRDILANALVLCEQVKLDPVLHVHDEIVNQAGDERFEEFMEIMSTPPPWAPDFPLMAEGYSGPVWTKQSKGYRELCYVNGRPIHG